ncbi:MAG TPA: preprotein translocase subunit YajC [Acidimicrobiales bacterium]|jgi:preprotein translocase subunit YajC
MTILFIPALLILMYFLLLRPQQQRLRKQRALVSSIDVGDDVVTAGGLIGRVVALKDDRAWLDIGDGVTIEFLRAAINRKLDDDPSAASFSADPDGADDEVPRDGPAIGGPDIPPEDAH